jgi:large subunit ribosomal protein L30
MKAKAKAKGARIRVRQIKSGIGYNERQKATLKALGLGKLGRVREHPDNPAVRGMIGSIPHLVVVESDGARS